jgi:hypothetical protein
MSSSLDDKNPNISRLSPAASIIDKKARSLLISLVKRAGGRVCPMVTSIAFTVYPVSHIERVRVFPLGCLDRPFVPLPMTAATGGLRMSV